jgi:hypothetical protein
MAHFIYISKVDFFSNQNPICPEIVLRTEVVYPSNCMCAEITGDLFCNEVKVAKVYQQLQNGNVQTVYEKNSKVEETKNYIDFYFTLTEKALEFIEDCRSKHKKNNVELKLKLYIKVFTTTISLGNMVGTQPSAVLYSLKTDSDTLLEMEVREAITAFNIPQSTWVQDFLPLFGRGKYLLLEIPQITSVNGKDVLIDRINGAIESLRSIEKELLAGEWNQVMKESRELIELLNNNSFKDYLIETGYTDEAAGHFTNGIKELFSFSSKFIHKIGTDKQLNKKIEASKEDAYMVYSLCANGVNLIARKMQKTTN